MQVLWLASVLTMAAAVARLGWLRLAQHYRFFVLYLSLSVLSGPILYLAGDTRSREYLAAWIAIDPLLQLSLLLSVAEVYGLVAGHYPRLGALGSWLIGVATVVSGVLCVVTASPELARIDTLGWVIPVAKFVFLAHRWTATVAFGSLLIVIAFFRWYNRPLAPNVRRHVAIMTAYLGAHAFAYLLFHVAPAFFDSVDLLRMLVGVGCGAAWSLSFTTSGQEVRRAHQTTIEELSAAQNRQHALLDETRRARPLG